MISTLCSSDWDFHTSPLVAWPTLEQAVPVLSGLMDAFSQMPLLALSHRHSGQDTQQPYLRMVQCVLLVHSQVCFWRYDRGVIVLEDRDPGPWQLSHTGLHVWLQNASTGFWLHCAQCRFKARCTRGSKRSTRASMFQNRNAVLFFEYLALLSENSYCNFTKSLSL